MLLVSLSSSAITYCTTHKGLSCLDILHDVTCRMCRENIGLGRNADQIRCARGKFYEDLQARFVSKILGLQQSGVYVNISSKQAKGKSLQFSSSVMAKEHQGELSGLLRQRMSYLRIIFGDVRTLDNTKYCQIWEAPRAGRRSAAGPDCVTIFPSTWAV